MKKILLITSFITINYSVTAQTAIDYTEYDTCNLLQQYAGDWLYTNGADTIKIYLKAHRGKYMQPTYIFDALWGFIEYKHGNTIVVSDYANRFITIPFLLKDWPLVYRTLSIRFRNCNTAETNLFGRLRYRLAGDQLYNVKVTLSNNGTVMQWHQEFQQTDNQDLTIPWNRPTGANAMPMDFILIKQ
ncbi:DUF6705 family protein [Ferruginibacter yonginensis]|uniref:DUF6705 family protein n=1 Tax=Ferruginibacter yonginensis TaxID=1310416 RepID=A0ABV8QW26_9BACT